MDGESENTQKHRNPVSAYIHTLGEHKNFFKSTFRNYFFGKYKAAYLGIAWHFLTPLFYFVLCYFMMTAVRGRESEVIVLLASGIFVYHILIGSITGGATTFISGAGLIKKMHFPREMLIYVQILIHVLVALICYAFLFAIIAVLNYGVNFAALMYFPLFLALSVVFAIGCQLFLSSVTVYVRDIQYFLSAISMAFFVLSPLRQMVSEMSGLRAQIVMYNPMTYFMEPMHQIFYLKECPDLWWVGMAALCAFAFLTLGAVTYHRLKRGIVERL
ncbi:MAG: ABC transporter permease [archaeon]|nr:ABC transporter permease [archaeon]